MSAAPRTALWGGRDGEGGRRRRRERERERGGPAEGRGLRESGGGAGRRGGRGAGDAPRPGVPAGVEEEAGWQGPGSGVGGALPFSCGDHRVSPPPPRLTRHPSNLGGGRRRGGPGVGARGGGRGRGYAPGLVAVARKQWGGGSRWEDGAHTPALRRAGGRAGARSWGAGRAPHPTPEEGRGRRGPPRAGAGLQGEGPAGRHADARERREDASELRVACAAVAPLTSGSRAAGGWAEAPGRAGKGGRPVSSLFPRRGGGR